jgi:hypothetical protein
VKPLIRIASGQGFWGDLLRAPVDQVRKGPIDYLVMDYLAEVTMSILQKQRRKDPRLGYARDLIPLLEEILPECMNRNIKIITNGGGVNPEGCSEAIVSLADKMGVKGLKVGVVCGDDILDRVDEFLGHGIALKNMDTSQPLESVRDKLESANVYFGASPIAEALRMGAQIVVTGRTTDTGLTLGPMMYEFGWSENEWDKLAAGTITGHILECGGQASGGNFSGDWKSVPDLAHIGFPIAEAKPSGEVTITKHTGTGGMVTVQTIKEQLVYEIGDPKNYITPDCVADFTSIRLEEQGKDRVKVSGVKGGPATDSYKVSMAYLDGYTAFGTLTYSWPDALQKAKRADEILRTRMADLGLEFEEIRTEYLGYNSCHGPLASSHQESNEVVLRIGVRGANFDAVERFGKELAPLILTGPPTVTGFAGGRPKAKEVISYWPALIPKTALSPKVSVTQG